MSDPKPDQQGPASAGPSSFRATFAHCRHCAWSHPAHTKEHAKPCGSCPGQAETEPALFEAP